MSSAAIQFAYTCLVQAGRKRIGLGGSGGVGGFLAFPTFPLFRMISTVKIYNSSNPSL